MSAGILDLSQLLQSMHPTLHEGTYAYCSVLEGFEWLSLEPIAMFRESEGLTLVLREHHSDPQAIGLTAAVATALSAANISCNVIAGAFHDHLFVPVESAQHAMQALWGLQQRSRQS